MVSIEKSVVTQDRSSLIKNILCLAAFKILNFFFSFESLIFMCPGVNLNVFGFPSRVFILGASRTSSGNILQRATSLLKISQWIYLVYFPWYYHKPYPAWPNFLPHAYKILSCNKSVAGILLWVWWEVMASSGRRRSLAHLPGLSMASRWATRARPLELGAVGRRWL